MLPHTAQIAISGQSSGAAPHAASYCSQVLDSPRYEPLQLDQIDLNLAAYTHVLQHGLCGGPLLAFVFVKVTNSLS